MKKNTELRTQQLESMARRIVSIVASEQIPEGVKDAIYSIAERAIDEAFETSTRAEYVNERFVRAMLALDGGYASGVYHSLQSVMETAIDEEVYQTIFDESSANHTAQPAESKGEETGLPYPTKTGENGEPLSFEQQGGTVKLADNLEIENTALLISGLLNNPNVPRKIRGGLENAIDEFYGEDIDQTEINAFWKSPEYIAMVLRGYEKAEVSE